MKVSICVPFASDVPERIESFAWNMKRLDQSILGKEPFDFVRSAIPDADGKFDRSASRNHAASMATGDLLVFMDADSAVDLECFFDLIQAIAYNGASWGFPYNEYVALSEEGSRQFMAHPSMQLTTDDVDFVFPSADSPESSVGGCIAVIHQAFEQVGGYDERFQGWGEEDRAFAMVLQTFYGPPFEVPGRIYHLWHPSSEPEQFGQPHWHENRLLCNRYRLATGNRQTMWELINERR